MDLGEGRIIELRVLDRVVIPEALGLGDEMNLRAMLGNRDGLAGEINLVEAIRIEQRVQEGLVKREAIRLVDGIDSESNAWTNRWTYRRNRLGRSDPN